MMISVDIFLLNVSNILLSMHVYIQTAYVVKGGINFSRIAKIASLELAQLQAIGQKNLNIFKGKALQTCAQPRHIFGDMVPLIKLSLHFGRRKTPLWLEKCERCVRVFIILSLLPPSSVFVCLSIPAASK